MKKIIGLIFAAIVLVAGFSIDSLAQRIYPTQRRTVNVRERRQQTRIYNGVGSGRLTRREAYRLERRQVGIRRAEARDRRSGGRFTYAERRNIQRRLNRSNRAIYRQKHDRQNYRYPRKRL